VRHLIVSDIHSNWEALHGVLTHVRRKRFDRVLFLGDAVGYGASPNQVVGWLRSLGSQVEGVRGNHDRVCSGLDSPEYFNRYAREASTWTLDQLDPRHLEFVRSLPVGPRQLNDDVAICHGSAIDEDAYIFSAFDATLSFEALPQRLIFFGHTHVPSMFALADGGDRSSISVRLLSGRRIVVDLEPGHRYLINPGSVGQPRDRDPRASYAIYDDEASRLYVYRVDYRVSTARRRVLAAGLPPVLGDRLLYGV
jgi:predicted phosphodiesterase